MSAPDDRTPSAAYTLSVRGWQSGTWLSRHWIGLVAAVLLLYGLLAVAV